MGSLDERPKFVEDVNDGPNGDSPDDVSYETNAKKKKEAVRKG